MLAPVILLAVLIVAFNWPRSIKNPGCQGKTMGTTYNIRLAGKFPNKELERLTKDIDSALVEINRQMSTWDPSSEISMFNHAQTTEPVEVSADFAEVVSRALSFSASSGGAFDPTLQPLLNLWGFGSEAKHRAVPSKEEIDLAKSQTGWEKVSVAAPDQLIKKQPEISLALGAIAKGYGVDAIAGLLQDRGYENWFVEIGGEVTVHGNNPDGEPWKIGIQFPSPLPGDTRLQGILHISNGAVATSGDYRNYIEQDGALYSHILDPRSGRALYSTTASVSVYADNCTDADAIATTLFVMGPETGIEWIENQEGVEALFLERNPDGSIAEICSSGFCAATEYDSLSNVK